MCLPAGPYGTSLQLVYLGLSLAFGSYPTTNGNYGDTGES